MQFTRQAKITIALWGLLVGFLTLTEPSGLPVLGLIVPFVLLFAALFTLWAYVQQTKLRYFARGRPHLRIGAAACGGMVLLVALQSLGQLSVRDVVIVGVIITISYLYSARAGLYIARS